MQLAQLVHVAENINNLRDFLREHCLKSNLQQLSYNMFCKNVARLAVAMGCHTWIRSIATRVSQSARARERRS